MNIHIKDLKCEKNKIGSYVILKYIFTKIKKQYLYRSTVDFIIYFFRANNHI